MNSIFFNKTKSQEKPLDLDKIDVSFVNENIQLCSATSNLTGDEVLMLSDQLENAPILKKLEDKPRLNPYYSVLTTNKTKAIIPVCLGYVKTLNTIVVQQNATRIAKYVYLNYVTLLNRLASMSVNAPNSMVKTEVGELKQEVIVCSTMISNIIKIISNNSNPPLNINMCATNLSFANEIKNAQKSISEISGGLVKLIRIINIPQITNLVLSIATSTQNINQKLLNMQSC